VSHVVRIRTTGEPETQTWEPIRDGTGFAPVVSARTLRVLVGERDHRFYVLRLQEIEYVESHDNYVKLHGARMEFISRDSVKRLAEALFDSGFIRIKRSLLINIQSIAYAERAGRGTYAFTLLSGSCLHSSSKFRDEILRVLPLSQSLRVLGAAALAKEVAARPRSDQARGALGRRKSRPRP
jgi:DNA-binding LytR/AlgR family response regulator